MEKTNLISFVKKNWLIILILLVGAFLRLYKIDQYMIFLGDEGRDAMIVRNLIVHADPILIGPGTSVGGMYLGPLYYYFMAPFLLLWNFSPVGPAIGVALLGIATIYLVYLVGKKWFGNTAGLIASSLYAISPTVIIYSHSSWNPNIMPFFALLSIYAIWRVWKKKEHKQSLAGSAGNWLFVTAISFAFVLQSHYLGILIAPVLIIYWILSKPKYHMRYTIYSVLIFSFLMSPLLIFDIRHNWMNSKALYKFLTVRQETVSIRPWTAIPKSYPIFEQINASLLAAKQEPAGKIITLVLAISTFWLIVFRKKTIMHTAYLPAQAGYMLLLWLISGLIGFGVYKQHIYDHYFGFLFPAPFLLAGMLLFKIYESKYKIFGVFALGYLVSINLINSPIRKNPNNQLQRSANVAQKIIEESKSEKFNIAVVAEQNYEDGYQYFLEKNNAKIIEIDAQLPETVANQLFVICEKEKSKCDPTHSSKAEVANFGWSKIEDEWEVDGVIIYKLIHSK